MERGEIWWAAYPSVINVSQVATVGRKQLTERIGRLSEPILEEVDEGLAAVMALARARRSARGASAHVRLNDRA